jgi:nicotinamidase-related amidase
MKLPCMDILLVIDMQNAWLNDAVLRFEKDEVISRINLAAEKIRVRGGKVIFVRHCDIEAVPGSFEWQIDPKLAVTSDDCFIEKTACDSFAHTGLHAQLQTSSGRRLYVCGLATEFCVDTTIRAAISMGYDVVALADAHTTSDRPHLTAERIIEHHNWVWANLAVPNGRKLSVKTVKQAFND